MAASEINSKVNLFNAAAVVKASRAERRLAGRKLWFSCTPRTLQRPDISVGKFLWFIGYPAYFIPRLGISSRV